MCVCGGGGGGGGGGVQVGPDKPEMVASFCYLGDMLSAAGGCELSNTTRVKTAWKKFKELLPVLSSRHLSFKARGYVYSSSVWSELPHASDTWPLTKPNMLSAAGGCELSNTTRVKTAWKKFKELLPVLSSRHLSFKARGYVYSSSVWSELPHASDTWPLTKPNIQRLQQNDSTMIRQICNVRPQDVVTTRSNELLVRLGIEDLDLILKERRLRWYGHVERSNGAAKTAFHIQVEGKRGPGRPKMTWKQLKERDCREWKLSAINPHDRSMWRSGMRSGMRAASQLSGRWEEEGGGG